MIDVFVAKLETRVQRLEEWCKEHETEGLDYGNDITAELDKMREQLIRLTTQMKLTMDIFTEIYHLIQNSEAE